MPTRTFSLGLAAAPNAGALPRVATPAARMDVCLRKSRRGSALFIRQWNRVGAAEASKLPYTEAGASGCGQSRAELHSAVSQNCILRSAPTLEVAASLQWPADYKSAIRQIENPCYFMPRLGPERRYSESGLEHRRLYAQIGQRIADGVDDPHEAGMRLLEAAH